ncbi:hypothetical protein [Cupriavidus sp. PET2-C1]
MGSSIVTTLGGTGAGQARCALTCPDVSDMDKAETGIVPAVSALLEVLEEVRTA